MRALSSARVSGQAPGRPRKPAGGNRGIVQDWTDEMVIDIRPWRLAKLMIEELGSEAGTAAGLAAFSRAQAGNFAEAGEWIEAAYAIRTLQNGRSPWVRLN